MLAVADTDSYLKWSVGTLAGLPADWSSRQLVLRNAVMPSADQTAAAGGSGGTVVSVPRLLALVRRERPDVLLLACTGPVVRTLSRLPALRGHRRPVLLTGLPGISYPASARALELRRGCDLFLVHSHRERVAFAGLVEAAAGTGPAVALARLPYLTDTVAAGQAEPGGVLVFAPQALVPAGHAERAAILRALAAAGPVLVKVRAASGEQQTHRELHPYDVVWAELVARGEVDPDAVRFTAGAMSEALTGARGLTTVSSTAALEAIARGLPVLVIDDFGVSAELINLVFAGSGCIGAMAGLATGDLRRPNADWLVDNYFHPSEDSDWLVRLRQLVEQRSAGGLPRPSAPGRVPLRVVLRQYARLTLSAEQRRHVAGWTRAGTGRRRGLGRRALGRLRRRRDA